MAEKDYFASLEPVLAQELERFHCPSLALGVIRKGEILRKVPEERLLDELKYELDHWNA